MPPPRKPATDITNHLPYRLLPAEGRIRPRMAEDVRLNEPNITRLLQKIHRVMVCLRRPSLSLILIVSLPSTGFAQADAATSAAAALASSQAALASATAALASAQAAVASAAASLQAVQVAQSYYASLTYLYNQAVLAEIANPAPANEAAVTATHANAEAAYEAMQDAQDQSSISHQDAEDAIGTGLQSAQSAIDAEAAATAAAAAAAVADAAAAALAAQQAAASAASAAAAAQAAAASATDAYDIIVDREPNSDCKR